MNTRSPVAASAGSGWSWFIAARIKTLGLAVTPVVAGTWLAAHDGRWSFAVAFAASLGAMFIQIGTNLWNDAADGERGHDGADRLGPPRATGLGLLTAAQVRRGALLAYLIAALAGGYLVWIGGWPILAIGLASLALGYLYSLGPLPISYTPFSEALQILFFGVIAVGGVYYLHTGTVTREVMLTGMLFGLPGAAVLLTNNHRDRDGDARAGRRTLPILLGITGSRVLYALLLVATAVGLGIMFCTSLAGCIVFALLLGFALSLAANMAATPISAALNRFIGWTALYQMAALAAAMIARATV